MSRNVKSSAVYMGAYAALIDAGVPVEKANETAEKIAQSAVNKARESTVPHKALALGYYRIADSVGVTNAQGMKGQSYYWSKWNLGGHIVRIIEGEAGAQQRTQRRLLLGTVINGIVTWQDLCAISYALDAIGIESLTYLGAESAMLEEMEKGILKPFTLPELKAGKVSAEEPAKETLNREQRRELARKAKMQGATPETVTSGKGK